MTNTLFFSLFLERRIGIKKKSHARTTSSHARVYLVSSLNSFKVFLEPRQRGSFSSSSTISPCAVQSFSLDNLSNGLACASSSGTETLRNTSSSYITPVYIQPIIDARWFAHSSFEKNNVISDERGFGPGTRAERYATTGKSSSRYEYAYSPISAQRWGSCP
jgi:hypothetical protein